MKIKDHIRGSTRKINLTFLQSDKTTPVDLTGGKVYFTVSATNSPADDLSPVFQKVQTTHTSPTLGLSSITILPTDTAGKATGSFYYDVRAIVGGVVTPLKQDSFVILNEITTSIS